jgi:hypothetical protein
VTRKDYQKRNVNDLNVFIGALQVFTASPAISEGDKIYLPAEEIKTLLRANGNATTVEKNGVAYVEVNDLVSAKMAASVEKLGNAIVPAPVVKKGNLLLEDSGDIPYYTEATAYIVDMTARVEDGDTIYSLFNIKTANAGIRRDLTNDIKMYGNGKYELKFEISGNGNCQIRTYLDTADSTSTVQKQTVFLSGGWKTVSIELDVNFDMNAVKCYSFSVGAEDTGLSNFEIKNIMLKKID